MTTLDPRTRLLLRQADKNAAAGKRSAAVEQYEQILAESPKVDAAWSGLASVLNDETKKREAFEKALSINPENEAAAHGLAILRGEIVLEEDVVEEETAVEQPPTEDEVEPATTDDDLLLTCYRHSDRETGLRCYNCQNPICMECTRKTPVGYLCPDCYREKEDVFFNSKTMDYIIAPLIAFPLSLIIGFIAMNLRLGFFFIFFLIPIGGAIGGGIGRLAKRAVGYRRGRYLPHTVAAMVILGILIPALPALLLGQLGALLMPGIILFVATGAAFYAMR